MLLLWIIIFIIGMVIYSLYIHDIQKLTHQKELTKLFILRYMYIREYLITKNKDLINILIKNSSDIANYFELLFHFNTNTNQILQIFKNELNYIDELLNNSNIDNDLTYKFIENYRNILLFIFTFNLTDKKNLAAGLSNHGMLLLEQIKNIKNGQSGLSEHEKLIDHIFVLINYISKSY